MVFRRCKRRSLDWSSTLQSSTGRIIDVSTFRYRCWYTSRICAAARGPVVRGAWKGCSSLARIVQFVCKNNIQVVQLNCFALSKRDKKPSKKVNIFYFMNIIINNTKTDTCFRNNFWRTGTADSHLHALVLLTGASWVSAVTTSVLQSGWLLPELPFKVRPSKLLLPDTPELDPLTAQCKTSPTTNSWWYTRPFTAQCKTYHQQWTAGDTLLHWSSTCGPQKIFWNN